MLANDHLLNDLVFTRIADTPGDCTLLARGRGLVGLAVNAQVHDVVPADGTVVYDDVPSPQRDRVPLSQIISICFLESMRMSSYLLDLKLLLAIGVAPTWARLLGLWCCVGHFYVGHGVCWFVIVRMR